MDRRASAYNHLSKYDQQSLWQSINQGRTAYKTLSDLAESRKATGKNGFASTLVETFLKRSNEHFLQISPFGEYVPPSTVRQSVIQIDEARISFDKIVILNLPLVASIAQRYQVAFDPLLTKDDVQAYGQLGLIQAAERFDHTQQIAFGAYATRRISGAIVDAMRELSPFSRDCTAKIRGVNMATQEFWSQSGRAPTLAELSEITGLDQTTTTTISTLAHTYSVSLNSGDTEDWNTAGHVPAELTLESNYGIEDHPDQIPEMLVLHDALGSHLLTEKELFIINQYFYEELTLRQIAPILEISTTTVNQLLARALTKLRVFIERPKKAQIWSYIPELDQGAKLSDISETPNGSSIAEKTPSSPNLFPKEVTKNTPDLSNYDPKDAEDLSVDEYRLACVLFPADPSKYSDIWTRNQVSRRLGKSNSWVENHRIALSWKLWYENDAQRDQAEVPPLKSVLLQRLASIPIYAKTTMSERDKIMWMEMDLETLRQIAAERGSKISQAS